MALLPFDRGDFDESRRMIDESQQLAAGRSPLIEAVNLWMYAQFALENGRAEEAVELTRRSAERADEIGWAWWVSGQRTYLARVALRIGDIDMAEREGREGLEIAREHENRLRSAGGLSVLAQVALARHETDRAGLLWGATEAELTSVPFRFDLDEYAGELLAQVDSAFASARERGRRLQLWDAVAVALGELDLSQTEP
jgi:ATP/maltotriose-dependent transcriptional regulator MalT